MADKTITIKLRCNFADASREESIVEAAKQSARELLTLARFITVNDRLSPPKMSMVVSSFYDDDVKIDIQPTNAEVLAEANREEDPFADF